MDTATEHDAELVDEAATGLELRRPDTPVTLSELAARKGEALEIIDARVQILDVLRRAAIRATSPQDWVLFKSPDDNITGYLQDAGCERVRDLSGIEIFKVGTMQRISTNDPDVFHYIVSGSGRRKLTGQVVENVEGGRSSTDDFCKDKKGAERELAVRKAARANLDGRIVRELAGLSTVPLEEIVAAWDGTSKKAEQCRKGRGFGTGKERVGGVNEKQPDLAPPRCTHCNTPGVFKSSSDGGYYYCPNYKAHQDKRWNVNAKKWADEQQKAAPAAKAENGTASKKSAAPQSQQPQQQELTSDETFGGRQPGEEG